jgi:putative iron-regulated protein
MFHQFATHARVLPLLLLASLAPAQEVAREVHVDPVIRGYADLCYTTYTAARDGAAKLEASVRAFAERPERATLDAARKAWIAARLAYSRTETFRFYGGPIDDVEPLLNAWPVDEAYIDCVPGLAASGIVHDVAHFPRISEHVLTYANERGGETNVSVGWHAIEFLLWGQDLDPNGPGDRSPDDCVDGKQPHADRRRQYLLATTRLLTRQLGELAAAWAPETDNYRRRFERDPSALRLLLTGTLVFTAFELGGERLAVAYETKAQEQEHSCFSDTTCSDLVQNQLGLVAVLTGELDGARIGTGVLTAIERADPQCAANLQKALAVATSAIAAIPHPFDQAFLGDDTAPGRRAILAAIEALEQVAEALTFAGHALGYELPMRPGH